MVDTKPNFWRYNMKRPMDRPQETLFDLLTTDQRIGCVADKDTPHEQGFLEKAVNTTLIDDICQRQQKLTMHRVAHWLRGNALMYSLDWEAALARELDLIADDLDYLTDQRAELDTRR